MRLHVGLTSSAIVKAKGARLDLCKRKDATQYSGAFAAKLVSKRGRHGFPDPPGDMRCPSGRERSSQAKVMPVVAAMYRSSLSWLRPPLISWTSRGYG